MSVTVLRHSATTDQPHTLAMWRPQPGALMLLGRTSEPVPKAGSVRKAAPPAAPGMFRAEFWPLGEQDYAFLAAIRLLPLADRADGADLVLRGARRADREIRLAPVSGSDASAFGKEVAALAGVHAAHVTRFLLDVMRSDRRGDMRQPDALLAAFLAHAARTDGCVELIMHVPQRCVLLQGWGTPLPEQVELLLPGSTSLRYPASAGDFTRADLAAPAIGSVLALEPDAIGVMSGLDKVFLLTEHNLLSRQVVEPSVLDAEASIGQIRHLLPRLNCPPPLQTLLRTSLQPLFAGHDTLNSAGRPVRAALDMAVAVESGGTYLSGWIFDPAHQTAELHLCGQGVMARLDESWTRIPRRDVSAAFAADPAFPSPLRHDWGFAVTTAVTPPLDQPAYLRFTFADGDLAFVPVRFARPDTPSVVDPLLASVDLHISSGLTVLEQHLAPFMSRLPPPARASNVLLRGPLERARAIVVPLPAPSQPRSFMSGFLLDPALADEQIIFACGPTWERAQLDHLFGLLRLYALPATVIGLDRTPLPADAVSEAAAVSQADQFLLVSPVAAGGAPGWRSAIYGSAGDAPVVCPTVLFEDHSVRFAGPARITFLDHAPFTSVHAPLAGASADLAGDGEPVRAASLTLACCAIRRAALPALTQATRFKTEAGQEAAFVLSLREAGLHATWSPAIRVLAPEPDAVPDNAAAPLIDGWMLRHTWREATSCAS